MHEQHPFAPNSAAQEQVKATRESPEEGTSHLQRLNFTAAEMAALAHNGTIHFETRGRNRRVAKLRFRIKGVYTTKSLGSDPDLARAIQGELDELRRPQRARRQLHQEVHSARNHMRAIRSELAPVLAAHGFNFHGFHIRCPRRSSSLSG